LTDPELPSDVRDAIWHIFTTKEIPMSYEELAHLGMREFHEASMRMGEERGRHEGRQEGRQEGAVQASLALAERLLPAEEVAALHALPPEQVLDAVAARLRPR
jgi:predicted transposase YdaD